MKKKPTAKKAARRRSVEEQLAEIQDVFVIAEDGTVVVDQGPSLFDEAAPGVVE